MDQRFAAIWNAMNDALVAGDKERALTFLSSPARDKYGPVFDILMTDYAEISASFSPLQRGILSSRMGEYLVRRNCDGTYHVFFI